MNVIEKIRLYFAVRNAYKEVSKVKAGYRTTEFWITVFTSATALIQTYGGSLPEPWGIVITAIVTAGYTISRGLAKKGASDAGSSG